MTFSSVFMYCSFFFFFSSRRRHTRYWRDWSSDVCSSDLGATVLPVPRDVVRDPAELLAFVEQEQPTIWRSVPSLWERVLAEIEKRSKAGHPPPLLAELRWISVGGEARPASYVRRWMDIYVDRHRISNHYGPTEPTINATCYLVDARPGDNELRIPIGSAIRGTTTLVLDGDGRPCAPEIPGELYIGGAGLSPGYLGAPEFTAGKFLAGPNGERLYRTGDL